MSHPQPNVIFITTDHMRHDNIAANHNPVMHTPVLDRLAAEGVSMDQLFVQSPTCMPSRASIWTGRYTQNHRVTCNGIALRKSETTLAHALARAGYQTANVGKLHFQPHSGFDIDHTRNADRYAGYGYEQNLLSDEPGCYPDA
jgi:arylsulfatase A-like enzyme